MKIHKILTSDASDLSSDYGCGMVISLILMRAKASQVAKAMMLKQLNALLWIHIAIGIACRGAQTRVVEKTATFEYHFPHLPTSF